MRHPVLRAILPALALGLLATCDEGNDTYDQTWFVQYTVSNQSSVDVTVDFGSFYFYCYQPPVVVPAGTTKELAYYEEFLGPTPDANRTFTCISVYRDSDSILVYQLAPVRNSQFRRIEHRKYHEEYKLELTNAKLSANAVESHCGEIRGSVIDSLTAQPVDFYHVSVFEDPPQFPAIMQTNTGPSNQFRLIWNGDVPHGMLYISRRGYRCRALPVPEGLDSLGNRSYRLDADMAPFTAPEDSIRYGSCFQ